MDHFSDVDGAFKSLSDTLQNRLSPFFDQTVSEAWLGALGHASAIARNVAAWNNLPESSQRFVPVASDLDRAARRLASASGGSDTGIIDALENVENALEGLETLLAGG
jgi:hypothetical protein